MCSSKHAYGEDLDHMINPFVPENLFAVFCQDFSYF